MLISKNLHKKSSELSIKARSTPASLSFIGQVTKHTTVKWSIVSCSDKSRFLGRIQVFTKWDPIKGAAKGSAPVGDPWEILEFLVLRNAISGILRQSQRVLISRFLKLKFPIFALKYNRAAQNDIRHMPAGRSM